MLGQDYIKKVLLIKFAILILILLPSLSESTDVMGIIYENTTWNLAGSPYNLLDKIQVADNVTLTIEPGVVINGNDNNVEIWGSLVAIGDSTSNIALNNIRSISTNSAIIDIQYATITSAGVSNFYLCGNGGSFSITDSKLYGVEIQAYCENTSYIERNSFIRCGEIYYVTNVQIRNNLFYEQTQPIRIESTRAVVEYNSFLSTDRVALYLYGNTGGNLEARNNFWNTTDTNIIDSMIYDRKDDLYISYYATYVPFLTEPHPNTPIPDFSQAPIAKAGIDQVVFDSVTLDGSGSYDPDGNIVLFEWKLAYRGDSTHDVNISGANPLISNLYPGFYDVYLTVTDNSGLKSFDSKVLAAAGVANEWPTPNAGLSIKTLAINKNLKNERTSVSISGTVTIPDLSVHNGDTLMSRTTIELFGALSNGNDLVFSQNNELMVEETTKTLTINK